MTTPGTTQHSPDPAAAPVVDWTERLEEDDLAALRALPFARIARIPPPKTAGLPVGHELRILLRYLRGRSSSLDPSAFTRAYLGLHGAAERTLYRAFVLREALGADAWAALLGPVRDRWVDRGLLFEESGGLRARFVVTAVDDRIFVVDPQEKAFPGKVHIGQDSLNFLHFLARRPPPPAARILDVGTGSGVLLIGAARGDAEALGVDLNPRAVRAARINVSLNGLAGCTVSQADILDAGTRLGTFDLALWNAPFMFFPEEEREDNLDGYGGELGIGVTLGFVERMPELLAPDGRGIVMTAGPVLREDGNQLENELRDRADRLGLDVVGHVLQSFWVPHLGSFHRAHRIERFESMILEVTRGTGGYRRRPASLAVRTTGLLRQALYRLSARRSG